MEMKDRLWELQGKARNEETSVQVEEEEQEGYGESLDDCFTQTDMIAKATGYIEELSAKLEPIRKTVLSTLWAENDEATDRHADIMKRIKEFNRKAINGLKRLDMEIKTAEGGPERNSAEFRIKKAQHATLTANLRQAMMDCNTAELEYQEELKKVMKKKLKTNKSDTSQFTEDQLEEMVESKDPVFAQDLMVKMVSRKEDLKEIEERKTELLKLEKNIKELEEMFLDLMLMVEEQGDLMDHIETQVEAAAYHVYKGAATTATAVRLKKGNTTLKWIICIVVTVIIGVLLLVIAGIVGAIFYIQSSSGE